MPLTDPSAGSDAANSLGPDHRASVTRWWSRARRIPVDGEVVDGVAIVNQSAITGETCRSASRSERVHAGSVGARTRGGGDAHAVGNQTTIGRIISRVEEAQLTGHPSRTVGENFSRRFCSHLAFIVSAIALLITGDAAR